MSVCAIVVTRDRRALLVDCLAALRAQKRPPDAILVVDNASSDGTVALLRAEHPDVELLALPENRGGAGGFHAGVERAHAAGHEWLWIMDDDTVPAPGALAALLATPARLAAAGLPAPALLASKVVWTDGRLHPMNAPGADRRDFGRMVAAARLGLLPIRSTTFVSLLAHAPAVARHGLPLAHYFIWSDDLEWTARLLRREPGYLVPDSVVEHRTARPYTAITDAGERFYFHVRNTLYMVRGSSWGWEERFGLLHALVTSTAAFLVRGRLRPAALATVARGLRDGLRPQRASEPAESG